MGLFNYTTCNIWKCTELNTSKQQKFTADSNKAWFYILAVLLLLDTQVFLCHPAFTAVKPSVTSHPTVYNSHPRSLASSSSGKICHCIHRQPTCLAVMLWLSKCLRSTSPCDNLANLPMVCWNWLRSRSTPSSFFLSDPTESSSFPKSLDVSKGHFSRIHASASFASA